MECTFSFAMIVIKKKYFPVKFLGVKLRDTTLILTLIETNDWLYASCSYANLAVPF